MDDEKFLSGYCRRTDGSRTVTAELEAGKLAAADCDYGCCPHQSDCPIAKELDKLK